MTGAIDKAVSPLTFESSSTDSKKTGQANVDEANTTDGEFAETFEQVNSADDSELPKESTEALASESTENDDTKTPEGVLSNFSETVVHDEISEQGIIPEQFRVFNQVTQTPDSALLDKPLGISESYTTSNSPLVSLGAFANKLATGVSGEVAAGSVKNITLTPGLEQVDDNYQLANGKIAKLSPEISAKPTFFNTTHGLSLAETSDKLLLTDIPLKSIDDADQALVKSTISDVIASGNKPDILSGVSTSVFMERSPILNSTTVLTSLPVTHTGWGEDVGQKVLWMASQGLSEAEIQLDPPELGPLQAKVTVNNDQVQVTFNSHSAQVREALEQTVARLRELFSSEGIDLVDVNVSDNPQQEQRQNSDMSDVELTDYDDSVGDDYQIDKTSFNVTSSSHYIIDDYI